MPSPDVKNAISTGSLPAGNAELKVTYEKMHQEGQKAWFDAGDEERMTIISMGEPWDEKVVLEIGCGEGELATMMMKKGASVLGVDYSETAIQAAKSKHPGPIYRDGDYKSLNFEQQKADRVVMQGVLEHLDKPWEELGWILRNLVAPGGDIITSSPMFCNPRGYVWQAYAAIGAVMSKTDLHFLDPWEFEGFCLEFDCKLSWTSCEHSWANGRKLLEDFEKRLPLALRDGGIKFDQVKLGRFLHWLGRSAPLMDLGPKLGAVAVYKISTGARI